MRSRVENGAAVVAQDSRRGRAGVTLIELMISMGILSTMLLYSMNLYMTLIYSNRQVSTAIATTNSIRCQGEEMLAAARDNFADDKTPGLPAAALAYYAGLDNGRAELSADNSRLTYTFDISAPAVGNAAGTGVMTIYLNPEAMPPMSGSAVVWRNLGDNPDTPVKRRAVGVGSNPEGTATTVPSVQALTRADVLDALNLNQLPVDIRVTYSRPGADGSSLYQTVRRVLLVKEKQHPNGLAAGEGPDAASAEAAWSESGS